jgi:hypothetical protein
MAKSAIPNPLERRHLIEKDLGEAQALEIAEAYLAAGRAVEAVDFLAKANAREQLAELRSRAIEMGDVFLLRAVARAMEEPPARTEWNAIADAAAAAGKDRYAVEARRQLDRVDDE